MLIVDQLNAVDSYVIYFPNRASSLHKRSLLLKAQPGQSYYSLQYSQIYLNMRLYILTKNDMIDQPVHYFPEYFSLRHSISCLVCICVFGISDCFECPLLGPVANANSSQSRSLQVYGPIRPKNYSGSLSVYRIKWASTLQLGSICHFKKDLVSSRKEESTIQGRRQRVGG